MGLIQHIVIMDSTHRMVWLLLLVIAPGAVVKAGYNLKEYCSTKSPGTYQNPSDCNSFVICTHGRTVVQSCGGKMRYNPHKAVCDYERNVKCDNQPYTPPVHEKSKQLNPEVFYKSGREYGQKNSDYVHTPSPDMFKKFDRLTGYEDESLEHYGKYEDKSPERYGEYEDKSPEHYGEYKDKSPEGYGIYEPNNPYAGSNYNAKPSTSGGYDSEPNSYYEKEVQTEFKGNEGESRMISSIYCIKDGMFQDPYDCSAYFQCAGGRKFRQLCPYGTAFSPTTETCGYDSTYCEQDDTVMKTWTKSSPEQLTFSVNLVSSPKPFGGDTERLAQYPGTDAPKVTLSLNLVHLMGPGMEWTGIDLMGRMRKFFAGEAMRSARRNLSNMLKREAEMARTFKVRRTPYSRVVAFLGATPYTKQLSIPAFEQLECLRILRKRFNLNKVQIFEAMQEISSELRPSGVRAGPDMDPIIPQMGVCPYPMDSEDNDCDRYARYRTIDGSCNNMKRPLWGKSFRNLARLIPTDYADGIDLPRRSRTGNFLPSARSVSLGLLQGESDLSHIVTVMHQTIGQLVDHDLDRTAITKLSKDEEGMGEELVDVTCGDSECETDGMENEACLPIYVPKYDPDFTNKTCVKFVRSSPVMNDNCKLGTLLVNVECGKDGCDTAGEENEACLPILIPSYDPDFVNKTCLKFVRTQRVLMDDCRNGTLLMNVMCGEDGCETEGEENDACLPISVPAWDPDFHDRECLKFVRTTRSLQVGCRLAPREQLNQITSYFDASMVYGSDKNQSEALRDRSVPGRGMLKITPHPFNRKFRGLLPRKDDVADCRENNATVQCFTAGDGRVNEQVGLAAIHHVWHRGHNSIEHILHQVNPHWNAETLFQETRRIIYGSWQHIVYNEYIPIVFGQQNLRKFGLDLVKDGYFNGYDETINADTTNSFATAAFRFGHSQIGDMIRFSSQIFKKFKEINFSEVFNRPGQIYSLTGPGGASGVDSIILGMLSQRTEVADRFFSKEVTARLFSENPPKLPGLDLPAINIQRGRDHGLPGYMAYREFCGLYRAKSFKDLEDIDDKDIKYRLQTLYESVDDIDLYAGGMLEKHIPGGIVGPTFACILAHQFRNSRVGDRFWYERKDSQVGFTAGQLRELRKFTLAYYICENLDRVDTIQKFVMLQPFSEAVETIGRNRRELLYDLSSLYRGDKNERAPCFALPQPNFNEWRDRSVHTKY